MKYELVESRYTPGEWVVEGIDYDGEGEIYIAIFSGPLAKERAEQYVAWIERHKAVLES